MKRKRRNVKLPLSTILFCWVFLCILPAYADDINNWSECTPYDYNNDAVSELACIRKGTNVNYIYYRDNTEFGDWTQVGTNQFTQIISFDADGDGYHDDLAGINSSNSYILYNIRTSGSWGGWTSISSNAFQSIARYKDNGIVAVNMNGKILYTQFSNNSHNGWSVIQTSNMQKVISFDQDSDGVNDDLAALDSSGHVWYSTNLSTFTQIGTNQLSHLISCDADRNGYDDDLAGINYNNYVIYTTDLSNWTSRADYKVKDDITAGDFDGDGTKDDLAVILHNDEGVNADKVMYLIMPYTGYYNFNGPIGDNFFDRLFAENYCPDNGNDPDEIAGINHNEHVKYTINSLDSWSSESHCCGDGTTDYDGENYFETCDGSDTTNCSAGYPCTSSCTCESCGDEYLNTSIEECENDSHCGTNEMCSNCDCVNSCGNGVKNTNEVCDGTDGCSDGYACNSSCSACEYCGDGVKNGNEVCDGTDGCSNGYTCNSACTGCGFCGDTVVNGNEECESDSDCTNGRECVPDHCTCASIYGTLTNCSSQPVSGISMTLQHVVCGTVEGVTETYSNTNGVYWFTGSLADETAYKVTETTFNDTIDFNCNKNNLIWNSDCATNEYPLDNPYNFTEKGCP